MVNTVIEIVKYYKNACGLLQAFLHYFTLVFYLMRELLYKIEVLKSV